MDQPARLAASQISWGRSDPVVHRQRRIHHWPDHHAHRCRHGHRRHAARNKKFPSAQRRTTPETCRQNVRAGAPAGWLNTLRGLASGTIPPRPQNHDLASNAPLLKKKTAASTGGNPPSKSSIACAVSRPWPGALTTFRGQTCQIWGERLLPEPDLAATWTPNAAPQVPGALLLDVTGGSPNWLGPLRSHNRFAPYCRQTRRKKAGLRAGILPMAPI